MSRWASGDVDVLFAAEEAEVGRPFEDERLGRAADAEADADRPERRTIGELVAGPRVAAPRRSHQAPSRASPDDHLKGLRRGGCCGGPGPGVHQPLQHNTAPTGVCEAERATTRSLPRATA